MTNPYLWLLAIVLAIVVVGAAVAPLMLDGYRGQHRMRQIKELHRTAEEREADELMRMGW